MKDLIFVSNNGYKLNEIRKLMPSGIHLYSISEAGVTMDIEETGNTFEANARLKAETFFLATGKNCFADDSGLSVDFLNGSPGVYSARYAGDNATDAMNRKKLLAELGAATNRNAHFVTVLCLVIKGCYYFFEGKTSGVITTDEIGTNGFGYDSIFIPDRHTQTFAQMSAEQKNTISHRAIAVKNMAAFIALNQHTL